MLRTFTLLIVSILFCSNLFAQMGVTISGVVKEKETQSIIPYANVIVKSETDNTFVTGAATNEEGRFIIENVSSGNYILEISIIGFNTAKQSLFVGELSKFLDVKTILLTGDITSLDEVLINTKQEEVSTKMDKKTYSLKNSISQSGGSVLQAMQNLPSVTIQDGKVQLRGNDKVTVLIDGKQTALTGFGNQNGLDNIPASAIEKIEI